MKSKLSGSHAKRTPQQSAGEVLLSRIISQSQSQSTEELLKQGNISKALGLNVEAVQFYIEAGNAFSKLGKHYQAIDAYDKVLELQPNNTSVLRWKKLDEGNIQDLRGKYEKAIKYYSEAIDLDPNYAMAYSNRAHVYNKLGKYSEAFLDCVHALGIDKKLYLAWNNKGMTERGLGKHDDALKSYEKVIELKPDFAIGYDNKGSVLNNLRRYEDAKDFCSDAIKLDPNLANAYSNRAFAFNNLQRYEDAILDCNKAIDLKQDLVNAWLNKGLALGLLAKYKDAVKWYDEMLEIFPHDNICIPDVYCNKGYTLSKIAGEENNALLCLNKAIELRPGYTIAYCSKGRLLQSMNREKEALECFNKALSCNVSNRQDDNLSTGNLEYIERSINIDREELFTKLRQAHVLLTKAKEDIKRLDQKDQHTIPVIEGEQALERSVVDIMSAISEDRGGRQTPDLNRQIAALTLQVQTVQQEIKSVQVVTKSHTLHLHDHDGVISEVKNIQVILGQEVSDLRQDVDVTLGYSVVADGSHISLIGGYES